YFAMGIVYLVFSVAVALCLKAIGKGPWRVFVLFVDTVFFLMFASHGMDHVLWMGAAFYLFLLAEAVWPESPREGVIVPLAAVLVGSLVPTSAVALMQRTVVVGGVLACAFAWSRKRSGERQRQLGLELAEARKAVTAAVENERQRIASDFHDGPLQS